MKSIFTTILLSSISLFGLRAAGIEPGVYKVTSYASQKKVLSVLNSSSASLAKINIWTNTGANSQYWNIEKDESGNFYYLTNIYSGLVLYMPQASDGTEVIQSTKSTRKNCKWEILPSSSKDCYYITSEALASGTKKLFLEASDNTEGASVKLAKLKDANNTDANVQIWMIEPVTASSNSLTEEIRDEMMKRWKIQYYNNTVSYSGARILDGGWWSDAEIFETILDAYETTGDSIYRDMFKRLNFDFLSRNGGFWCVEPGKKYYNEYNDDIAWMVIASVRANLMFGDQSYLNTAKNNFDAMYARALLPSGMLRWKETAETINGTNSCINGPAEVAACYLGMATGDVSYYEKAKKLYALQRQYLYEPATGKVYDSFRWVDGVPSNHNYWSSTYNQGTFLGAALMLYKLTGEEQYRNDADKIVEYTKKELCDKNGIFKNEDSGSDLPGFKGILMRYLRRYIVDLGKPEYVDWLRSNAMRAYNNRNTKGISWTAWVNKTPETATIGEHLLAKAAFGTSTAVSVAFNTPLNEDMIIKDAFSEIGVENFNYLKGIYVKTGKDKSKYVTNISEGCWLGYENVNFGDSEAKSIELVIAKDGDLTSGGVNEIEIRLDSISGTLIGKLDASNIKGKNEWTTIRADITPLKGRRPVYLSFKGFGGSYKIMKFKFNSSLSGLDESGDLNDNIYVYPTLVRDYLNINLPEVAKVDIYSTTGQLIHTQILPEGLTSIDASHLEQGTYIINIARKGGTISRKLIKQ